MGACRARVNLPLVPYPNISYAGLALAFAVIALVAVNGAYADQSASEPLPDREAFLGEVRKRLRSDAVILRDYTYRRTVVERDHDGSGAVRATRTKVYDVHPLPDDPEGHRVLVSENGRAVAAADVARSRQEYERKLARARQRAANESPRDRQRREAKAAERARDERANVEDVVRLYDVQLERREVLDGLSCIVVRFTPRRDVEPKTRAGHILRNVVGRAWFDEREYELVRADAEVVEPIRYGWGVLARIAPGSRARVARTRTTQGTWLPRSYEYSGSARVLLVAGLQRDVTVSFTDFRQAATGVPAGP